MSDEQFERYTLEVLARELGVDGFARFLRLYMAGAGDYTCDRHRWLGGATVQEVVRKLETRKPA